MSEKRNIIITISGDPSSGKSTTVEDLAKIYKMLGFEVKIKSVGKESRPLILEEYKKYLEQHPEIPKKDKITIEDAHADPEFSLIIRKKIDTWIDEDTKKYGEEISSQYTPNVVYIIDGRLAWAQIPNSFSVRITCDDKVAGERAYKDKSRGFKSRIEAEKGTRERKNGERKRYKIRYGINLANKNNYNLVVDNTYLTRFDVVKQIIKGQREFSKNQQQATKVDNDYER